MEDTNHTSGHRQRGNGIRRAAFWRGLRSHSPLMFITAALLAVAALAGLQWFVSSGAFTVIPEQLMLRIRNDDYVHLSYLIADLKRMPPTKPVVYLFGGSGTMEMMRSQTVLGQAISTDAGMSVQVISLAAHAQSIGETLALIDNLPRGHGVLAIGLSPTRFTASPAADATQLAGSPYALTSPHLAAELAGRTVVAKRLPGLLQGVFDFSLSWLNQRLFTRSPNLGSISYDDHYYTTGPIASPAAKKAGAATELALLQPQFSANIGYNLAVLAEAVRLGRAKGYGVTFFEQPLGPEASTPAWDSFLATYHSDVASVMHALNVPDIAVQAQAGLSSDNFADLFHLVDSGRDKWTPPFALAIAPVVRSVG